MLGHAVIDDEGAGETTSFIGYWLNSTAWTQMPPHTQADIAQLDANYWTFIVPKLVLNPLLHVISGVQWMPESFTEHGCSTTNGYLLREETRYLFL